MGQADTLLSELVAESASTRRLLERLPADRLDWKPNPKSMSLGTLANHVATIPENVAEMSVPDTRVMGSFETRPATTKDAILENHDKSLRRAQEILRSYDDARLQATWKMVSGDRTVFEMPRIRVLRTVLLNHLYHHRGQLTVYLRCLDVPLPSTFGPSADENPFR